MRTGSGRCFVAYSCTARVRRSARGRAGEPRAMMERIVGSGAAGTIAGDSLLKLASGHSLDPGFAFARSVRSFCQRAAECKSMLRSLLFSGRQSARQGSARSSSHGGRVQGKAPLAPLAPFLTAAQCKSMLRRCEDAAKTLRRHWTGTPSTLSRARELPVFTQNEVPSSHHSYTLPAQAAHAKSIHADASTARGEVVKHSRRAPAAPYRRRHASEQSGGRVRVIRAEPLLRRTDGWRAGHTAEAAESCCAVQAGAPIPLRQQNPVAQYRLARPYR